MWLKIDYIEKTDFDTEMSISTQHINFDTKMSKDKFSQKISFSSQNRSF